jgi:PIN domain nuclease of toxin-antitoxin system
VIFLLDAHALLWWLADDPTLDNGARSAICDPASDVLVSAATVWEIGIKRALGKLEAPDGVRDAIDRVGFVGLPVTLQDAEAAGALQAHHRDPFDRVLVAQATRLGAIVITRDAAFRPYGIPTLRA